MNPICVAGQGRCGTSMVMQMLNAGGITCHGEYPAFEPEDIGLGRDLSALMAMGKAFKLLDPHRDKSPFPICPTLRVIWLDRNSREQAKSQVKMIETFGGFNIPNRRRATIGMAESIEHDRHICLDLIEGSGAEVFTARFETILKMPYAFAHDLAGFLRQPFDEHAAAKVVIPRPSRCMPDMRIEARLCAI